MGRFRNKVRGVIGKGTGALGKVGQYTGIYGGKPRTEAIQNLEAAPGLRRRARSISRGSGTTSFTEEY